MEEINWTQEHMLEVGLNEPDDFLINSLRPRKRYTPWLKAKKLENLEYVKEFYGYNNEKAKAALDILNDEQISYIKRKLNKGGKDGRN